jgi:hypothetical protein
MWRFERRRTFYIGSLRVKLVLACPRGAKMSLVFYELKYVALHSVLKLPLRMHHKWNKIINFVCKITNGKS